jgi:hypothetical protein
MSIADYYLVELRVRDVVGAKNGAPFCFLSIFRLRDLRWSPVTTIYIRCERVDAKGVSISKYLVSLRVRDAGEAG